RADRLSLTAKPGEVVRLRITNSGNDVHFPVLVGASFTVIALDGHDLNAPTALNNVALPIGPAQRYDVSFMMPSSGSVALIDADPRADAPLNQHPLAVLGSDPLVVAYPADAILFDFSTYGTPGANPPNLSSDFDVQYNMALSTKPGLFN